MIIERHNVVAQKAVMPKKMPKHKKIVVEDDIQVYLPEHSMARANLNKSEWLVTNTTKASKYTLLIFVGKL